MLSKMLALTLEEKKMPFLGASFMTFFNQLMEAVSQVWSPDRIYPGACCPDGLLFPWFQPPVYRPPTVLPVALDSGQRPLVLCSTVLPEPSLLCPALCLPFGVLVSWSSLYPLLPLRCLQALLFWTHLKWVLPTSKLVFPVWGNATFIHAVAYADIWEVRLCPLLLLPPPPILNILSLLWAWVGSSLVWLVIVNLLLGLVPLSSFFKHCSRTDSCIWWGYHHV